MFTKQCPENVERLIVNFSDQMDRIRAIKSPWEIQELKKVVKLHDDIMACVPATLRPGRTEKEVADDLRRIAYEMDCLDINIMAATHPKKPFPNDSMYGHEIIKKHDYFSLLLEFQAPAGFWGELIRIYSLGEPSANIKQACKDQLEIQAASAAKMVPGARPSDIQDFIDNMVIERGYFKGARFMTHGQGYDIVDRPIFTKEETMTLEENMFIAHHPMCVNDDVIGFNCDNYLITKNGAIKLNTTPAEVIVVDY